jgi:hypothetical protein
MTPEVQGEYDRRGARAKARSSPPCSFNWLITSRINQEFHHLKLTKQLSSKWGAPQSESGGEPANGEGELTAGKIRQRGMNILRRVRRMVFLRAI